jgi:hypothetical protein
MANKQGNDMHGEVVKAEFIVNQNPYLGTTGPKARILTTSREVWWVYQGNDGMLEMACVDHLSDADYRMELNPR